MEQVILVDENNNELGVADKETVHTKNTPLHRAFSLFVFNSKNELLLTQRALTKKTFPGVWTNTVCGHVAPGESALEAAQRRVSEELGLYISKIKEVAPYRYRFADQNGVVENEICPIFVGFSDQKPKPDPLEVYDLKWVDWHKFIFEVKENPKAYSPWSVEETLILENKTDLFSFN